MLGGCGTFANNNVILATVEVSINENFLKNAESIFEVIRNCVEMITYGDEVFTNEDFSKSELQEFIDQFTINEVWSFSF